MSRGRYNLTYEKQFNAWHLHGDSSKRITSLLARGSDIKDMLCNAYVTIEDDLGEKTIDVCELNGHDVDVATEYLKTFVNEAYS